jgi:transposase
LPQSWIRPENWEFETHRRKNHYGSRSLRGTQVAAVFYTLCETAKLVAIDPHAYLLRALYTAIAKPGAVTYPEELILSTPTT